MCDELITDVSLLTAAKLDKTILNTAIERVIETINSLHQLKHIDVIKIPIDNIERCGATLFECIKTIRDAFKLPLKAYDPPAILTEAEYMQLRVVDISTQLNLHLGGIWGFDIDTTNINNKEL